ncbi:MAG: D-aminoacylase [Kiloniellales bacterium]|nr:D-aminoacylase [Kiloniellales bacterium]
MRKTAECDVIIRNGTLIDGTGRPRRRADVAVDGDRIAALGDPDLPPGVTARREIDASGLVVAPGFIDVHTHDDNAVLAEPRMTAKVSQGVTSVIVGNCGISLAPIADLDPPPPHNLLGDRSAYRYGDMAAYLSAVEAARPNVNVAALVGHGTLRLSTMNGQLDRPATAAETEAMRTRLRGAMAAGALGMSSGVFYKPSAAAPKAELAAVAGVLAETGGLYVSHLRNEDDGLLESLEEAFETAHEACTPLVISHHKVCRPQNYGKSVKSLRAIEEARRHHTIGLDAYPYSAGSTVLDPDWVDERIGVMVTWSQPYPEAGGRDLAEIAGDWNCGLREAAERLHPAGAVYFQMDEEDVRRILAYPPTMIGSDGLPHDAHPHPRLWGTFPRVLGHYSRDVGLFPLEIAVHKMSGLSARTFGLKERGEIQPGNFADIVLFDPDTVKDAATFAEPTRASIGIDRVLVNGAVAFEHGSASDDGNGQVIRR